MLGLVVAQEREAHHEHAGYSHIPNSSIGRNNSIGWKTTKN